MSYEDKSTIIDNFFFILGPLKKFNSGPAQF